MEIITPQLIHTVRIQYAVSWDGVHGVKHFERVRHNGLILAERTGARRHVVELFAYLHDSKRVNDAIDPDHGARGAQFALSLRDRIINIDDEDLELLAFACAHHTRGWIEADVTVQTCWDADRLDIGRVLSKPDPEKLCTDAARDPQIIEWAYEQSLIARAELEARAR